MKALLLSEYKKLSVTDVDKPELGDDDVLVQVICQQVLKYQPVTK